MDYVELPYNSNKMARALAVIDYEFDFVGADYSTTGLVYTPLQQFGAASDKIFLVIGGTSDNTTATMSVAVATAMADSNVWQQASQVPINFVPVVESNNLITGIKNYFGDLDISDVSIADKVCVGFCIQGIELNEVVYAELCVRDQSAMADEVLFQTGPVQIIPDPVTLGANSKINDGAGAEISILTATLCYSKKNQLLFGSFKLLTSASLAIAAGDVVVLKIKAKV